MIFYQMLRIRTVLSGIEDHSFPDGTFRSQMDPDNAILVPEPQLA
jgi:hypothetical protein